MSSGIGRLVSKPTTRAIVGLLMAHHPDCSMFYGDTFRIGGRSFCLGCAITYPTAVLALMAFILFPIESAFPTLLVHREPLLALGIAMGFLQLIKYRARIDSRPFRITVKVVLGMSIGTILFWIFTLPAPLIVSIMVLFIFSAGGMMIATYRYVYIRKVCAGCIYHGDWDICFGFRGFNLFCRMGRGGPRKVIENIFRKEMKMRLMREGVANGCLMNEEPRLVDASKWLYHEQAYKVPWLPLTGLEVTRRSEIPR